MMPPGAAMTVAQRGGRWVRAIIVLRIATGHRMLEFPSHSGASLPVAADVNAAVGATGGEDGERSVQVFRSATLAMSLSVRHQSCDAGWTVQVTGDLGFPEYSRSFSVHPYHLTCDIRFTRLSTENNNGMMSYRFDDLALWKTKLPSAKHSVLPPQNNRPNPLVTRAVGHNPERRPLSGLKNRCENGQYHTPMAAESAFRESVENEPACRH
jgi:hypothetical protein